MKQLMASLCIAAAFAAGAPAQFGADPNERLRAIVKKVADEMQQIDELLLRPGRSRPERSETERETERQSGRGSEREIGSLGRNIKELEELLQTTQGSQTEVVKGLDELIQAIEEMSGGSGSGSGEPQDGERPNPGEVPQQQRSQRQEQNQTPDLVRQQQQPDGEQPQDGPQQDDKPPEQRPGNQPPEGGTEQVEHGRDAAQWGFLPKYLQSLQTRGGMPEVPEKYRKYLEAYMKQGAKEQPRSR